MLKQVEPIESPEYNYTDWEDLEMTTSKALSMHCKISSILSCAIKDVVFPSVESNYISRGLQVPAAEVFFNLFLSVNFNFFKTSDFFIQDLIPICAAALAELCNAHGDLLMLRAVAEKYKELFLNL